MVRFTASIPPATDSADYIIIGSGIAGLMAAIQLSKAAQVILITKSALAESNTSYAQGGIAAAISHQDSPELHYQDTMMAGAGLCDHEAVLTLVHEGPQRIQNLIELNVPFDKIEGQIALGREAAHSRRRILHANGDGTGRQIANTLVQHVRDHSNIRLYDHHFAISLVTSSGRCRGVLVLYLGELRLFTAKAVILCTGGIGQFYGKTTNPPIATGDGMALAYNAGASLRDMEFVQFHPTALYLPPAPSFLISEAVRGEGGILLNHDGERFMPKYHAQAELAPRDVVARAIFTEIERTGYPSVFLDLGKIEPTQITQRFPNIYQNCLHYGLDITKSSIPVAPAAHYMMGGILTDLWGRTSIPGLLAAGEVSSTGVHGANRLASNSLLEGLVFGFRIAEFLLNSDPLPPPASAAVWDAYFPECYTASQFLQRDYQELHTINDHCLGIVRDGSGMEQALERLAQWAKPQILVEPNYFELQNMIRLTRLMVTAALERTESRGGHFRSDFPDPNNEWRKHIIFTRDQMEVE